MTHLDDDALVDIALGEPADDAALEHLTGCDTCRPRLESLRRTVRTTRDAESTRLVPPPDTVWAAIAREIRGEPDDEPDRAATVPAAPTEPASPARPGRRRPAVGWLAAAAVSGLAVGSAATLALDRDPAPASPEVLAAARLDPLADAQDQPRHGRADLVRSQQQVDLRIRTRRLSSTSGYLEVWLLNRDGKRMVSVGVLRTGSQGQSFPVSQDLIDRGYVIVDISQERYDRRPEHSGLSLLRGELLT